MPVAVAPTSPALLGRAAELAMVGRLAAGAAAGRGAALVVHGEPGIGKSALLAAVASGAEVRGFTVSRTAGLDSVGAWPFAGLRRMLQPFLSYSAELPPHQRDVLEAAFAHHDAEPAVYLVALAALELVVEAAGRGPVALFADDAHRLDRPSADALAFLARRVGDHPVLLVAAVEPSGELPRLAGLPELALGGLALPDAGRLLDRAAPGLTAAARAALLDQAAGNPLALIELPKAGEPPDADIELPSSGERPGVVGKGTLAERLEAAFGRRACRLSPAGRALLLVAAAEPGCDAARLRLAASALVGQAVGAEVMREAAGLLVAVGVELRFRHPLVRSAVYARAGAAERVAAHEALAEVLGDDPRRQLWHRAAAATGPDEALSVRLEEFAEAAHARHAAGVAFAALRRAADLARDPRRRGGLLVRAAELAARLGEPDEAAALVARAEAGSRATRAELENRAARAELENGAARAELENKAARAELENRATGAEPGDRAGSGEQGNQAARVGHGGSGGTGRPEGAPRDGSSRAAQHEGGGSGAAVQHGGGDGERVVLGVVERGRLLGVAEAVAFQAAGGAGRVRELVAAARAATGAGQGDVAAELLWWAGFRCFFQPEAAGERGAVAGAIEAVPLARDDVRRLGVLAYNAPGTHGAEVLRRLADNERRDAGGADELRFLANAALVLGDLPRAARWFADAAGVSRERGLLGSLARTLGVGGWASIWLGDLDRVVVESAEACVLAVETGEHAAEVFARINLAMVAALRGDVDAAAGHLDGIERVPLTGAVEQVRARVALLDGRAEEAFRLLAAVFEPSAHPVMRWWLAPDLADAAVAAGGVDAAREVLGGLAEAARRMPSPMLTVCAQYAAAVLAPDDLPYTAALRGELGGWRLFRARLQLRHGERRRDPDALRAALAVFDELGLVPWATRARHALAAAGPWPPAAAPQAPARGLPERESQVARLAAGGLTNRQIAERLYLSHRTVAAHLGRVYTRLGVTGRAQLATALQRSTSNQQN